MATQPNNLVSLDRIEEVSSLLTTVTICSCLFLGNFCREANYLLYSDFHGLLLFSPEAIGKGSLILIVVNCLILTRILIKDAEL